ncbi:MAG: 1-phosphofructokinase [Maledivibacter sp.]|nr:1-phosphofructokinase [Maledivibacter sp.]
MITTITLNPAIDKTMIIDNFQAGKVNRELSLRIDAAGKGINVSKVIQKLGGKSQAMGILAGNTGEFIKNELDRMKIEYDFMMIEGQTRTNTKIVDRENNLVTDINENGPWVSHEDLKKFEKNIMDGLSKGSIAVFSGSVPRNVDKKIYTRLINGAKAKGAKTILDADGELLIEGLKAGPYLVKPNIHELEKIFSIKIESTEEIIRYGKKILEYGVDYVVVSRGEEGSVLISNNEIAIVKGIKVEAKSTVGAGDSLVAAISLSISRGYTLEDTIKLAVATSIASVMTDGTQSGSMDTINELIEKVEFKLVDRGMIKDEN